MSTRDDLEFRLSWHHFHKTSTSLHLVLLPLLPIFRISHVLFGAGFMQKWQFLGRLLIFSQHVMAKRQMDKKVTKNYNNEKPNKEGLILM